MVAGVKIQIRTADLYGAKILGPGNDGLVLNSSDLSCNYIVREKIYQVSNRLRAIAADPAIFILDLYVVCIRDNNWEDRLCFKLDKHKIQSTSDEKIEQKILDTVDELKTKKITNEEELKTAQDNFKKWQGDIHDTTALNKALEVSLQNTAFDYHDPKLQRALKMSAAEASNGAVGGISPSTNFNNGLSEEEALKQVLEMSRQGQGPSASGGS